MEEKMMKKCPKSRLLGHCRFTTLSELPGNNIYTDHLENRQEQLMGGS